jgi:uncharacterized protein (DUF2235 family)
MFSPKITMVGVWDTVGSLGIPAIFGGVSPLLYGFLDTSLSSSILHAYQALAIDERRAEFPPTLWTAAAPGQTMEQVWFSGVHCDVGGSYPADSSGSALSDLTLAWMMNKAAALGLEFVADVSSNYPLPMDPKLHWIQSTNRGTSRGFFRRTDPLPQIQRFPTACLHGASTTIPTTPQT